MLNTKFNGYHAGRRLHFLDMGGDTTTVQAAPAPDYAPMASASKESAQIMADQANRVLAENQRQYDRNMEVAAPVTRAQTDLMNQSITQGNDYFNYMKEYGRPTEIALQKEAMKAGSEQAQEEAAGTAMADSRKGTTQQMNMIARQGARYGFSPAKMAAMAGSAAGANASAQAAAANGARLAEKNKGFAQKMDVAGLYRNLPGASQGAYGMAINSGNSAVSNSRGVGQDFMGNSMGAANIMGQGRTLAQSGLSSVLGAQGNYAGLVNQANIENSRVANQADPMMGAIGQGLGMWASKGFS